MVAEFNWWLLIVGLVVGAGLAWLVLADGRRREEDIEEAELIAEAAWLEGVMADAGTPLDNGTAEAVLRLHRRYLGLAPPDVAGTIPDDPSDPGANDDLKDPEPRAALPPAADPADDHSPADEDSTIRSAR
jgi:hypothetical protein